MVHHHTAKHLNDTYKIISLPEGKGRKGKGIIVTTYLNSTIGTA
jgi:hypothetical protein